MACRIVWSRTAESDLRNLVKYIARDSPHRAEHFGYKIVATVETLQAYPKLGRVVPEFSQQDLHEVIVRPYRVVYRIRDQSEVIEVLRIWHSARDTPKIT